MGLGMSPSATRSRAVSGPASIRMGAIANVALGIVAVASVLFAENVAFATWTTGVAGFVVVVLAGLRASNASRMGAAGIAAGVVNGLMGLVVLASPFVAQEGGVYVGLAAAVGLLIAATGASGAWASAIRR